MQHHDRLTKAYKGLNADQLAALAFHYMTDVNDLELKRIADAVPLKDYRCPDVAYQARLDSITRFAACWGIEHWRMRCHKAEVLGAVLATLRRGDNEKADSLLEAHEQAEKYLLALDAVLVSVCADMKVDPADVRKMAGAQPFAPRREGMKPDGEMLATMRAAFAPFAEVE